MLSVPAELRSPLRTWATPLTTVKSIQNHLSDLHTLEFLLQDERNEILGGGQYYEYELDLEAEIVLDVRADIVGAQ